MIMNADEFRTRIEQLAEVTWRAPDQPSDTGRAYRLQADQGPGATIDELRLAPAKCEDCGIICTQRPRRDFQKRSSGWIEKCRECELWRNESGTWGAIPYKKIGRPSSSNGLRTNPVNSTECQSLPIEHDANNSCSDLVEFQDHDLDLESEPLVRPCPESCGPSDHLVIDISIHKC